MPSTSTRARRSRNMNRVYKANRASSLELASSLDHAVLSASEASNGLTFDIVLASDLGEDLRKRVWSIWETNMKELYIHSSFGWNPAEKRAELFHKLSRFLLACKSPGPDSSSESACVPLIVAYSMFRFEREDDQDVVYCYELQVLQSARHQGLGKRLMRHLVSIARGWEMQKIMLTVLKSNVTARKFYETIGFELDPTSPECHNDEEEVEEYDYEILCMPTSSCSSP